MKFVDQVARPPGIALAILFVNVAIYSQPPSPSLPPIIVEMEQPSRGFWDYLLIFTQVATLVGLLLYVYKTWQIASATRDAAELNVEFPVREIVDMDWNDEVNKALISNNILCYLQFL